MSRMEILHLLPRGEYQITKATGNPDWPHLLFTVVGKTKQAFHLKQNPTFLKSKPIVMETLVEAEATDPPKPSLRTQNRLLVVEANNPFPLAAKDLLTTDEKDDISEAFDEKMEQFARGQASREERSQNVQRMVFLILATTVALVSIVFALIVGADYLGGR